MPRGAAHQLERGAIMPDLLRARDLFRPFDLQNKALLGVCLILNALVLLNALMHDPRVGYDSIHHLNYIETLSRFRLPLPHESAEFYSPPLPYLLPSLLMSSFSMELWWAAKCAQLFNVFLSAGLTLYLLRICDLIKPGNSLIKLGSLAFLALVTVYYKTFSFVRGEPWVAFFAVFAAYHALRVFLLGERARSRVLITGAAMGLLALSRQWGFLLFPAVVSLAALQAIRDRKTLTTQLKTLAAILVVSFAVGSWFYFVLLARHGSALAFSVEPSSRFAPFDQPTSFFFGLAPNRVFTDPVRASFHNKLIPVFYSEIWGDYWAHFVVYGRDRRTGETVRGQVLETALEQTPRPEWLETNRYGISAYLGRVNLVSLLPSLLAIAGAVIGAMHLGRAAFHNRSDESVALAFCFLAIVFSLIGYGWFLIRYPVSNGVTIKATYLLHIFPFAAVLAGNALEVVRQKSIAAGAAILLILALVFIHNLPAMITRYFSW